MRALLLILVPAVAAAQPHRKAVAEQALLPPPPAPTFTIAGGASAGVADKVGVMPAMRAEVWLPAGLTFAVTASSRDHTAFRETSTAALVGYRGAIVRGDLAAWLGAEAGGGLIVQTPMQADAAYSGAGIVAPVAGASLRVSPTLAIALEGSVPVELIRRDGKAAVVALPAAWIGVRMDL